MVSSLSSAFRARTDLISRLCYIIILVNTFRSFRRSLILIFLLSLFLVYLATLTADYYWDGITFALQIEKVARLERGNAALFHQNHLLYNALGYLLYAIVRSLGVHARALCVLQITNALVGAVSVVLFFRISERLTGSRSLAIISSAALAFSAVWWKLATDANAYMISILLMLICANSLISAKPHWMIAGLALGGAMLIHQLASLFHPAAVVAVITNKSIEKKASYTTKLSVLVWAPSLVAYYFCAVLVDDVTDPLAIVKWALSNPSGVSLSPNLLRGLLLLPRGSLDMIVGHSFALFRAQDGEIEKIFAVAALVTAICFLVMFVLRLRTAKDLQRFANNCSPGRERWRAYAPMLITWLIAYIGLLLFWEPWQVLYRAFYLPPLLLVLGLAVRSLYKSTDVSVNGMAVLGLATLMLFNLSFFIAPHMRASSNPLIVAARKANQIWNENTVIYFSDHNEADTAFEYFNEQTEWRRLTTAIRAGLDDEIQQVFSQGRQVWINKGAAELVDPNWLAKYAGSGDISVDAPNAFAHYIELHPGIQTGNRGFHSN